MNLRPMRDDDLDRILELEKEIFPEPWSRRFFPADPHRSGVLCLVAEADGQVVGYIVASGKSRVHIANIAVIPGLRRRGIGRMMIRAAEEFGRSIGAGLFLLEVRESNRSARSFYRSLGFVGAGVKQYYYSNGEDAILMKREILPAAGSANP